MPHALLATMAASGARCSNTNPRCRLLRANWCTGPGGGSSASAMPSSAACAARWSTRCRWRGVHRRIRHVIDGQDPLTVRGGAPALPRMDLVEALHDLVARPRSRRWHEMPFAERSGALASGAAGPVHGAHATAGHRRSAWQITAGPDESHPETRRPGGAARKWAALVGVPPTVGPVRGQPRGPAAQAVWDTLRAVARQVR